MRNNPFIYPPSDAGYNEINNQPDEESFAITIEDSIFEGSGVKRSLKYPQNDFCNNCDREFFHEGTVLFLVAFDGKIKLRRNKFR